MTRPGEWIKDRRKLLGLRREDLVGPTGLSLSTLARVEKGEEGSNRATIVAVARSLKLDAEAAEALAEWVAGTITQEEFQARYNAAGPLGSRYGGSAATPSFSVSGIGTPIVGEVTAGGMVESKVFESGEDVERLLISYDLPRVYALRIRGDSMSPEYRPGEYLICQDVSRELLMDGEDAVIQLDGSEGGASTFKRVYWMGGGRVRLVALNPVYPSVECRLESIVRVGKVLGTYRPRPQLGGRPR